MKVEGLQEPTSDLFPFGGVKLSARADAGTVVWQRAQVQVADSAPGKEPHLNTSAFSKVSILI